MWGVSQGRYGLVMWMVFRGPRKVRESQGTLKIVWKVRNLKNCQRSQENRGIIKSVWRVKESYENWFCLWKENVSWFSFHFILFLSI